MLPCQASVCAGELLAMSDGGREKILPRQMVVSAWETLAMSDGGICNG